MSMDVLKWLIKGVWDLQGESRSTLARLDEIERMLVTRHHHPHSGWGRLEEKVPGEGAREKYKKGSI